MDVQRNTGNRRRRYWLLGTIAALVLLTLTGAALAMLSRAPAVDGQRLWFDTVSRGELLREISVSGNLVAPQVRAITNRNDGVVEHLNVLPGDRVNAGDTLITMSSPGLHEDLAQARWDLASAEAEEALNRVEAENRRLDLIAEVASAESEYTSARLELEAQRELRDSGVFSEIELERSRLRVEQLERRLEAERARMDRAPEYRAAQKAATNARLAQQRERVAHLESMVEALEVRSSTRGVVQEINPEEGERLTAGTVVARIVNPRHLIARLRVPEREASQVLLDMPVHLSAGNASFSGHVTRIDPTAHERAIHVDVAIDGNPPAGLRPEQSIQARIEIERLDDVLRLARPSQARETGQTLVLFVHSDDGVLERREVEIGALSADRVVVTSGLNPGERVALTDLDEYRDQPRLRIN